MLEGRRPFCSEKNRRTEKHIALLPKWRGQKGESYSNERCSALYFSNNRENFSNGGEVISQTSEIITQTGREVAHTSTKRGDYPSVSSVFLRREVRRFGFSSGRSIFTPASSGSIIIRPQYSHTIIFLRIRMSS